LKPLSIKFPLFIAALQRAIGIEKSRDCNFSLWLAHTSTYLTLAGGDNIFKLCSQLAGQGH
jgi:hypothetical protein